MRAATAHRDIARAVGVVYPAYVDDIIAHLAPFPVVPGPAGSSEQVWAAATSRNWVSRSMSNIIVDPLRDEYCHDALTNVDDNDVRGRLCRIIRQYSQFTSLPCYTLSFQQRLLIVQVLTRKRQ